MSDAEVDAEMIPRGRVEAALQEADSELDRAVVMGKHRHEMYWLGRKAGFRALLNEPAATPEEAENDE